MEINYNKIAAATLTLRPNRALSRAGMEVTPDHIEKMTVAIRREVGENVTLFKRGIDIHELDNRPNLVNADNTVGSPRKDILEEAGERVENYLRECNIQIVEPCDIELEYTEGNGSDIAWPIGDAVCRTLDPERLHVIGEIAIEAFRIYNAIIDEADRMWGGGVPKMKKPKPFGQRLVATLAAHDVTQAELARSLGTTPGSVNGICKGRHDPERSILSGVDQIRRIAKAIGCDVGELTELIN